MDLKKFDAKVARKKKDLSSFLKKLDKIVPEDMDELVAETDAAMWRDVSCMECANCCKTMTPTFSKKDIDRISAHLGMTPKAFKEKWLYKEKETGDWMNRSQPCQFLEGNLCSIYEVRPVDCAEFPHHHKKPFDLYNDMYKVNLQHCPATFTLVERLKKKVEQAYEW